MNNVVGYILDNENTNEDQEEANTTVEHADDTVPSLNLTNDETPRSVKRTNENSAF